jgi:hypothetical protein
MSMSDKKTAEEAARDYVKPDSSSVDVDGIDADLIKAYLAGWQGCREHEGLAAIEAEKTVKKIIERMSDKTAEYAAGKYVCELPTVESTTEVIEAYLAGWQGCREHEGLAAINECLEFLVSRIMDLKEKDKDYRDGIAFAVDEIKAIRDKYATEGK